VSETVKFGSREMMQEFGIKGYPIKKWHHDVEKPIVYQIHQDTKFEDERFKTKKRHFLDPYLKSKAHVPSPDKYSIT
jgi:hypothetical protein